MLVRLVIAPRGARALAVGIHAKVKITSVEENPDHPVVTVVDEEGNVVNVGLFELSFSSTSTTNNNIKNVYSSPAVSYGVVPGVGKTNERIKLITKFGDLTTMMDKNSVTGPYFTTPEGGRHKGLLAMYLDFIYPEKRAFKSIALTPYFRKTGTTQHAGFIVATPRGWYFLSNSLGRKQCVPLTQRRDWMQGRVVRVF